MISLERDSLIRLRLVGVEVSYVEFSVQIKVVARDNDGSYLSITISGPFRVRLPNQEGWLELDPEDDDPRLGTVTFALRYRPLISTEVLPDGTLQLDFGADMAIHVPPDSEYEAWQLEHKAFLIVCLPDGEIAVNERTLSA